MKTQTVNVAPRYSCGSPGLVDVGTARRVIESEREGYATALEGFYGEDAQTDAKARGLSRIAYTITWVGKWMDVVDLITGERTRVPAAQAQGKRWHEGYRVEGMERWTEEGWQRIPVPFTVHKGMGASWLVRGPDGLARRSVGSKVLAQEIACDLNTHGEAPVLGRV
jgi:hypothetical protein